MENKKIYIQNFFLPKYIVINTVLVALYIFCLLAFVNDITPRVPMKWGLINAIIGTVYFILVVVSLLSFSILPLLSIPFMTVWDAAPLYIATTLALIIIFILFHGELIHRLVKAEVEIAEKERRLKEQRIATKPDTASLYMSRKSKR